MYYYINNSFTVEYSYLKHLKTNYAIHYMTISQTKQLIHL